MQPFSLTVLDEIIISGLNLFFASNLITGNRVNTIY